MLRISSKVSEVLPESAATLDLYVSKSANNSRVKSAYSSLICLTVNSISLFPLYDSMPSPTLNVSASLDVSIAPFSVANTAARYSFVSRMEASALPSAETVSLTPASSAARRTVIVLPTMPSAHFNEPNPPQSLVKPSRAGVSGLLLG